MRTKPPPKELREIWDRVPKIECKGLCSDSCGPIGCSSLERKLVEDRSGRKLEAKGRRMDCAMLTANGRCSVYSIRPLICRIWGVVRAMRCPHGCLPERWMSDRESILLLADAARLAGDSEGEMTAEMLDAMPPEYLAVFADYVASGERNRAAFLERVR